MQTSFMRKPFPVTKVRGALAASLLISFVLIGQGSGIRLFGIGVIWAMVTVFLGFAFNNVPERSSVKGVMYALIFTTVITGLIVWLGIVIAPVLATLGR